MRASVIPSTTPHGSGTSWLYVDCSWNCSPVDARRLPPPIDVALPLTLADTIVARQLDLSAMPHTVSDRYTERLIYAAQLNEAGEVIDVYESSGRTLDDIIAASSVRSRA